MNSGARAAARRRRALGMVSRWATSWPSVSALSVVVADLARDEPHFAPYLVTALREAEMWPTRTSRRDRGVSGI